MLAIRGFGQIGSRSQIAKRAVLQDAAMGGSSVQQSKSMAKRIFNWYTQIIVERPLVMKTTTGFCTALAGDVFTQSLTKKEKEFDKKRLAAFSSFGALWTGPVNHFWLGLMERCFPQGGGMRMLVPKLALQHAFWNPFVYLPVFFAFNGALRGKDWNAIVNDGEDKFFQTYMSLLAFWVPASYVIFVRVPEPLQSVSMAGVSLVWNAALSFLANSNLFNLRHSKTRDTK